MSSDAIVFLKDEHKQMRKVFREFEKKKADAAAACARLGGQACFPVK